MADKSPAGPVKAGSNSGQNPPIKRGPGHRAVDARDAIAELTERAQEISLEAGSRVAIAMKDVISAAAGIAGFAVESARDLVTFMVRRGQMTQEEGDKLLREAEASHGKRPARERKKPTASEIATKERAALRARQAAERERMMLAHHHAVRAPLAHAATAKKAAKKSKPAKPAKAKAAKKSSKRR
jgi:polyhydroxyalkanoate synthesis regulator phasin